MIRFRPAPLLAVTAVLLSGTAASAQGYQPPARAWTTGFGQGYSIAQIKNEAGATFHLSCGNDKPASTFLMVKEGPGAVGDPQKDAVIEVDGKPFEWGFKVTGKGGGETTYSFDAYNFRVHADLERMVAAMRAGRTVRVTIPSLKVQQTFSLRGASAALKGLIEPCDPA